MTYHEIDNGIGSSLHSVILWQYEDAETLKAFVESMCEAAYLAVDDFWDKWAVFRSNVEKAATMDDGFGLSVIGATCGIPRPEGISNSMYAKLIMCRMKLSMTTAATTADYYAYINDLFDSHVVLTENPDGKNMSVGFDFSDWVFSGDLLYGATYSISSSGSGSSTTFTLYETIDGTTSSVSTFIGEEDSSTIQYSFNRTIDEAEVEVSITAKKFTIDESILYHSEDSNEYGKYWLILPTGVKRGADSWDVPVLGFSGQEKSQSDSDKVPIIGGFGTGFITKYQYEYATS